MQSQYRWISLNRYKTDISKTYAIFLDTKGKRCHFEKISNYIGFVYCYRIDSNFLPIALIFDSWIKYSKFFLTNVLKISKCDHFPSYITDFGPLKSEITNVESVQNRYYKCWTGSKPILQMLNWFKVLSIWNGYKMRNLGLVPI